MKRVGQILRENMAQQIKEGLDAKNNAFLISYSHLASNTISDFRQSLKKAGADVLVSKNTLAKVILKEMDYADLAEKIANQTAFVFGETDSVEISKILVKYAKDIETLTIQGALLDGRLISQDDVKRLADLPSREVLLMQLLGTIQAPVTRLLGAMNAKSRDLLSILKQLSEKKGGS